MSKLAMLLAVFGFVFAASSSASADCLLDGSNRDIPKCDGKIELLYMTPSTTADGGGRLLIGTDGIERAMGCTPFQVTSDGNGMFVLPKSNPLFEQFYSMLLAGQLSGRRVIVRAKEVTGTCMVDYVQLRN